MDYMLLIYISHCQHIDGPCEARPYHQTEIFLGQKSCLPNFGPTPPQRDGFYLNRIRDLPFWTQLTQYSCPRSALNAMQAIQPLLYDSISDASENAFLHRRSWMHVLLNFFYSTTESKNSDIP